LTPSADVATGTDAPAHTEDIAGEQESATVLATGAHVGAEGRRSDAEQRDEHEYHEGNVSTLRRQDHRRTVSARRTLHDCRGGFFGRLSTMSYGAVRGVSHSGASGVM